MMKKLYLKLFLAAAPLLAIVALYVCTDPFKVLYHYDHFRTKDGILHIGMNLEYENMEMFLKNYPVYKYDSYIFGSSRSRNYRVSEWERHISSKACFHFDAATESVYGVERKVNFLHKRGVQMKNVLFIIDSSLLGETSNQKDHIHRKHPLLSGESNLNFQLLFFKDFVDIRFIIAYVRLLITHKVTDTRNDFLTNVAYHYEEASNEEQKPIIDAIIEKDKNAYYVPKEGMFFKRDNTIQHYSMPVIGAKQKALLCSIKKIFDEDNTNYRIVISPLYDQKKLDSSDVSYLKALFGSDKVFDFSGINDITQSMYHYYDESHYRPEIATQILDSIYANKKQ